jgi:hypothetical protein
VAPPEIGLMMIAIDTRDGISAAQVSESGAIVARAFRGCAMIRRAPSLD